MCSLIPNKLKIKIIEFLFGFKKKHQQKNHKYTPSRENTYIEKKL